MKLRDLLSRATADETDLPPVVGTFLRGLSLGALVGAAVAGTVLMQRRRDRRDEARQTAGEVTLEPGSETAG